MAGGGQITNMLGNAQQKIGSQVMSGVAGQMPQLLNKIGPDPSMLGPDDRPLTPMSPDQTMARHMGYMLNQNIPMNGAVGAAMGAIGVNPNFGGDSYRNDPTKLQPAVMPQRPSGLMSGIGRNIELYKNDPSRRSDPNAPVPIDAIAMSMVPGATSGATNPNAMTMAPGATQPQPTQQQPTQPQRPSINQAAAEAIYGAGGTTAREMGFRPGMVEAGQLSQTNLDPYMNPFTEQVIKANEADILRGAQMGLGNLGARAQAAKAFGGSRHGIVESELGRNVTQQLAQSSAGLRQAGFQNAQQAALQDIQNRMGAQQFNVQSDLAGSQNRLAAANQLANIGNLGFGMGQQINQNLMQQGALQQGVQQALIDAAKQQYGGYTGAPASTIDYLNRAIGVVPGGGTQTTSSNPGLMGLLTSIASLASGFPV